MSILRRTVSLVLIVLLAGVVPSHTAKAVDPATLSQLAVYKQVIAELREVLDHTINHLDLALENRLESSKTKLTGLLKEIDDLEKGVVTDANDVLYNVANGLHATMADLRSTIRKTERTVYIDLNNSLINATRALSVIPFSKDVKPYVVATEPMRISKQAFDRRVFFYGYFPDVTEKDTATVHVGNVTFPLKAYTANRLGFDVPLNTLKEEAFLDIKVQIPHRTWWKLFKSDIVLNDRIYVERETPFAISIKPLVENPESVASVGGAAFHASADSNTPSVVRDITASDLFTVTVPNAAEYEVSTARFTNVQATTGGGRPCEHAPMTAEFRGWDANSVHFALQAGSIAPHWHSLPDHCVDLGILGKHCVPQGYLHGGGGSHADITVSATFSVRRKNVPQAVAAPTQSVNLRYSDTLAATIPDAWRQVQVLAAFKDGPETWTEEMTLSPEHRADSRPRWSTHIDGSTLTLQSR